MVVTGGTRGIGAACVKHLCDLRATVAFCSRSQEDCERYSRELRAQGFSDQTGLACDVSRPEQVKSFFRAICDEYGRIDVLIHSAGIGRFGKIDELTLEQWNEVIEINLNGSFYVCQEAMRLMQKRESSPRGYIICIGSNSHRFYVPGSAAYAAAKDAQRILAEHLFEEGRMQDILVSYLAIGSVDTSFSLRHLDTTGWKILPADVAQFAGKLIADFRENHRYCIPFCEMRVRKPFATGQGRKE